MTDKLKLTQEDYERFRDLVLKRSGLHFPEEKKRALCKGLAEAMEASRCTSLDEYYELLQRSFSSGAEWERLVSALTVGETYFFRNKAHFDALSQHILPEIIARRGEQQRSLRIWSAGCATGEEAYSVAILLHELIQDLDKWDILILATDINRDALKKAREGLYSRWSFRGLEDRVRDLYFHPVDQRYFAISDEIKRLVTFDYLNLVGDVYPSPISHTHEMDVILCRNVTIYFGPEVTQKVVNGLYRCLVDGGWLITGAAEPNLLFYQDFLPRNFPGTSVYQKPTRTAQAEAAAFEPPPLASARVEPAAAVSTKVDPYEMAVRLVDAGLMDEALEKLQEKLDQDPEFAPACSAMGKVYASMGNMEEARHWCEKAIRKDRLLAEPYYTLATIYQQHGLLDMAADSLKKTIYLDREFVLAHYGLAQLYRQQGKAELARKSLKNVQRLLEGRFKEEPVPEGNGLVVGRLLHLVEMELTSEM